MPQTRFASAPQVPMHKKAPAIHITSLKRTLLFSTKITLKSAE